MLGTSTNEYNKLEEHSSLALPFHSVPRDTKILTVKHFSKFEN